jgi:hypothetical protein
MWDQRQSTSFARMLPYRCAAPRSPPCLDLAHDLVPGALRCCKRGRAGRTALRKSKKSPHTSHHGFGLRAGSLHSTHDYNARSERRRKQVPAARTVIVFWASLLICARNCLAVGSFKLGIDRLLPRSSVSIRDGVWKKQTPETKKRS